MLRILPAILAALVVALGAAAALSSRTSDEASAAPTRTSATGGRVYVYTSIRKAGPRAPVDVDVVFDLFSVRLDGPAPGA